MTRSNYQTQKSTGGTNIEHLKQATDRFLLYIPSSRGMSTVATTPLIKTRIRQRPHSRTFWKDYSCVLVCCSQPINASNPHPGWPIRSRQRPPYIVRSCAFEHTSLRCASLAVLAFSTSVFATVNAQYLFNQCLPLLSLGRTAHTRDD